MKRKIFLGSVLATLASFSYAASNVTLYGQMDIGVVAGKAKHSSATFQERSGFTGMSRWGIKVDFSHYFRWLFANFRECSLIS